MLQSLAAPETILAAFVLIASYCFLGSDEQLSYTASLYSSHGRTNEMYIFSNDFLNLRTHRIFSNVQAFPEILFTCWVDVYVLENVERSKCL